MYTDKKTDEMTTSSYQGNVGSTRSHVSQDPYEQSRIAALCSTVLLFVGGLSTILAMDLDILLLQRDDRFTDVAIDSCKNGKSILYGWADTISTSIMFQGSSTSDVVGAYLKTTALFVLAFGTGLGNTSTFPVAVGEYEALFNMFRVMAIFSATYLVPNIPVVLPTAFGDAWFTNLKLHTLAATVSFVCSPLFEFIAAVIAIRRFTSTSPWGQMMLPTDDKTWPNKWHHKALIGLWLMAKVVVLMIPLVALYTFYLMRKAIGSQLASDVDGDCQGMQYMKIFFYELLLTTTVAIIQVFLSISMLCESSNGKVLKAGIIVCCAAAALYVLVTVYVPLFMNTFNVENDYRKLVRMKDDTTGIVNHIATLAKKKSCTANLEPPSGGWSTCYA